MYDAAVLSTDAMYLIASRFHAVAAAHAWLPTLRYTCLLYAAAILSMRFHRSSYHVPLCLDAEKLVKLVIQRSTCFVRCRGTVDGCWGLSTISGFTMTFKTTSMNTNTSMNTALHVSLVRCRNTVDDYVVSVHFVVSNAIVCSRDLFTMRNMRF